MMSRVGSYRQLSARWRRVAPWLAATGLWVAASWAGMPATGRAASDLHAVLPPTPIVAQGVSSANAAHLVRDRAWDFAEMRKTFNTIALLPGDPSAVQQARAAGLAVVLEFDYKAYFFRGEDISAKVDAVVQQIHASPGVVAAIDIADRINERNAPPDALRYLAATAGVLHREVPGIPVLVNVSDWQLTCGRPNQSSCRSNNTRFRYETDAAVDILYRSGYVDGFTIADNLKNNDVEAQRAAWVAARTRWPAPFILWSTCSQLSFPEDRYPGTSDTAAATAAAYMGAPIAGGADGLALWAWHQKYQGGFYSFLDKSGGANPLWTSMVATARAVTAGRGRSATQDVRGSGAPTQPALPARTAATRGSAIKVGLLSATGFAVILVVLGGGIRSRFRKRRAAQRSTPPVSSDTSHQPSRST